MPPKRKRKKKGKKIRPNPSEQSVDDFLKGIYYNQASGGAYSSLKKILELAKVKGDVPKGLTKEKVKEWLSKQDAHTVFKPRRVKFKRERIISSAMDQLWEGDLAQLTSIKDSNDGYSFILVVIDVFSKYAWFRPLKTKKSQEVTNAMKDILSTGRKPLRLRCDLGSEFISKTFKSLMRDNNIHLYHSYSESHSSFAERLIKTLKQKIFMDFYTTQTYRYIDKLSDIEKGYNNTYHSTIKMAPSQVNEGNELDLYMKVYMPIVNERAKKKPNYSFQVGDHVRISHKLEKFSRSYHETFTEEIFVIAARIHAIPPRYELRDLLGKQVKGSFYEKELLRVDYDPDKEFKIEKILGYKKSADGKRLAKIKWYGYGDEHISFIPESSVRKYRRDT